MDLRLTGVSRINWKPGVCLIDAVIQIGKRWALLLGLAPPWIGHSSLQKGQAARLLDFAGDAWLSPSSILGCHRDYITRTATVVRFGVGADAERNKTEEGQGGKESDGEFPVQRRRDNGIVSFLYPQHSGSVTRLPWRRSVRLEEAAMATGPRTSTTQQSRCGTTRRNATDMEADKHFCRLFRLSLRSWDIWTWITPKGIRLVSCFDTDGIHDMETFEKHRMIQPVIKGTDTVVFPSRVWLLSRQLLPISCRFYHGLSSPTQPLLLPLLFLHERHGGTTFSLPPPPLVLIFPTSISGSLCIKIVTPLCARNM